jgi:hypothetical protein
MLNKIAAGAAAFMIAAGAVAYAQQPPAGPGGHHEFAAEDRAAFLDARIAAAHAGLRLTPEQEKAWPAFEQAYRDLAALHPHHPHGQDADESLDPIQRLHHRAEALTARGAALKRFADALEPLYKSFDEGQKRRFHFLVHYHHDHHFAFWRGGEHGGPGHGEHDGPGGYGPPR